MNSDHHIYTAATHLEGSILCDVLAQHHIKAEMIPRWSRHGTEMAAEIWIRELSQRDSALALIEAENARSAEAGASTRCRACGEEVPKNFAECWSCGKRIK